ncbi:LysR family transcriptional regulator [Pandoraea bronchicola]|uniref:LysR family transcriptional regulator n=1 Tax=Pandoraea bronchicola TaxID=2508287 RepID=A0A5E5BNW6_9BURK|nr:LysR family transcriptional regulator [Pandoraea bronchicola]VVE86173.1 LysR family transcriptional regulator [Pandoraea bronchicola]
MDPEKIEGLWTHLHWLTVLAEQGSFTAAAARLGVSKAAMSQRIAELERAAGVSLVQRTTRSVRFTEAGQQLVDDTRGQYEHIATSFSNVRDQAGVARGLIRVTVPVAFGRQQVIPRLSRFLREHPEVRVQLDLSDRLSSIATEGFDLAIRHSTNAPETHVAWKLCDTRSLIVATRAYLKRRGTPASPWDLTAHDCLSYPRAQSASTWSFEQNASRKSTAGPVTIGINGPVAANNSEALRDAALDDLGVALLPDFTAQAAVRAGKLIVLLPEWRPVGAFAERIYVVRPYASQVPRAVKLFVDYLRSAFTDGFPC